MSRPVPPRPDSSRGRCPACGSALDLVEVHGHSQCAACGTNVIPCCGGAGDEVDVLIGAATVDDVDALVGIVRSEGSTLRDALLNRFAERTGRGWDVGSATLDAAVRTRRIDLDRASGIVSLPTAD